MANKSLFNSLRGSFLKPADTKNDAGGRAYSLTTEQALAQIAATGCLSDTFYASAETQLDRVLDLASKADTDFIAKLAIFSRQRAFMKDMPALLCAILANRDLDRLEEIFPQVIDNGKMLRNFVQIIRSGATGRKSLGSAPKRLVREWLERASISQLITASVGNKPSLADIVRMVHPRPRNAEREAFYAWLIGKPYSFDNLPDELQHYEVWKQNKKGKIPNVPFQMLTAQDLQKKHWVAITENLGWHATRMNINTFERHGVLNNKQALKNITHRISNYNLIKRSRVFPYQLLAAYKHIDKNIPRCIKEALQDALDHSLENIPNIDGNIVICTDVSGSMSWSVSGWNASSQSKIQCIDVAGLVSSAFLRTNKNARILPFEHDVVNIELNPRDSVMTNSQRLAKIGGGGTNCAAPLKKLNQEKAKVDLIIYVSDNESWIGKSRNRNTDVVNQWTQIKQHNPKAKMVCIDIVPNTTSQAPDGLDILNIGGFSDQVFQVIADFAKSNGGTNRWVNKINNIELKQQIKTA